MNMNSSNNNNQATVEDHSHPPPAKIPRMTTPGGGSSVDVSNNRQQQVNVNSNGAPPPVQQQQQQPWICRVCGAAFMDFDEGCRHEQMCMQQMQQQTMQQFHNEGMHLNSNGNQMNNMHAMLPASTPYGQGGSGPTFNMQPSYGGNNNGSNMNMYPMLPPQQDNNIMNNNSNSTDSYPQNQQRPQPQDSSVVHHGQYSAASTSTTTQKVFNKTSSGNNGPGIPNRTLIASQTRQQPQGAAGNANIRSPMMNVFVPTTMNNWACKHCQAVPLRFRAPGAISENNPDLEAVEKHLSMCAGSNFFLGGNNNGDDQHQTQHPPVNHHFPPMNDVHPQVGKNGFNMQIHSLNPNVGRSIQITDYEKMMMLPVSKDSLVAPEDRAIITDYFCAVMNQYAPCKFVEQDYKAKGGKRGNFKLGWGGMMCRHCNTADGTKGRKFFWTTVDRLANSFTEIPLHVQKCKMVPQVTKDFIVNLKSSHLSQMARLPRGSQKAFFRRLWRKIQGEENESEDNESSSDEQGTRKSGPVTLAITEDKAWLADLDVFLRKYLEVFETSGPSSDGDNNNNIKDVSPAGQVGLRCVFCSSAQKGEVTTDGTYFPFSLSDIYETTKLFRKHLEGCASIPDDKKKEFQSLSKHVGTLSTVVRRYSVLSAQSLGLEDTADGIQVREGVSLSGSKDTSIPLKLLASIANDAKESNDAEAPAAAADDDDDDVEGGNNNGNDDNNNENRVIKVKEEEADEKDDDDAIRKDEHDGRDDEETASTETAEAEE